MLPGNACMVQSDTRSTAMTCLARPKAIASSFLNIRGESGCMAERIRATAAIQRMTNECAGHAQQDHAVDLMGMPLTAVKVWQAILAS